jgi:hypothetical protein
LQVNHAHVYRSSNPNLSENWGNRDFSYIPKEFPWLMPLIAELEAESVWSKKHRNGARAWTALFFVDYMDGQAAAIKLEMKPSRSSLKVPSLTIEKDHPPTLADVQEWIIAHIHRET